MLFTPTEPKDIGKKDLMIRRIKKREHREKMNNRDRGLKRVASVDVSAADAIKDLDEIIAAKDGEIARLRAENERFRLSMESGWLGARQEEREACAKLADEIGEDITDDEHLSPLDAGMAIAFAIRARKP